MLLAFDVGNTNIVLGLFKDGKLVNRHVGAARKADLQPQFEALL